MRRRGNTVNEKRAARTKASKVDPAVARLESAAKALARHRGKTRKGLEEKEFAPLGASSAISFEQLIARSRCRVNQPGGRFEFGVDSEHMAGYGTVCGDRGRYRARHDFDDRITASTILRTVTSALLRRRTTTAMDPVDGQSAASFRYRAHSRLLA